jgi:hypothetical protein
LDLDDSLPHDWAVTSDSIAAWVAGRVGAAQLVLIKPPGADRSAVDAYFRRALPEGVAWAIVPVDRLGTLAAALDGNT